MGRCIMNCATPAAYSDRSMIASQPLSPEFAMLASMALSSSSVGEEWRPTREYRPSSNRITQRGSLLRCIPTRYVESRLHARSASALMQLLCISHLQAGRVPPPRTPPRLDRGARTLGVHHLWLSCPDIDRRPRSPAPLGAGKRSHARSRCGPHSGF